MPGFYMLISTIKKKKKNIKLNFQNIRLNTKNLTSELCKIWKDKIICIVENIVLNWLIRISNSQNYFIGEAFKTIYPAEYLS